MAKVGPISLYVRKKYRKTTQWLASIDSGDRSRAVCDLLERVLSTQSALPLDLPTYNSTQVTAVAASNQQVDMDEIVANLNNL